MNQELYKLIKNMKSPEELQQLAKENGLELSLEDAKSCLEKLQSTSELSDEELESVSGGCFGDGTTNCPKCGAKVKYSDLTEVRVETREIPMAGNGGNSYWERHVTYRCPKCNQEWTD